MVLNQYLLVALILVIVFISYWLYKKIKFTKNEISNLANELALRYIRYRDSFYDDYKMKKYSDLNVNSIQKEIIEIFRKNDILNQHEAYKWLEGKCPISSINGKKNWLSVIDWFDETKIKETEEE